MRTLAELSFEYIWLLLFADEGVIDSDYSATAQESLAEYFRSMNQAEKSALSDVAKDAQDRLLADPDEHGYTSRTLITNEQKLFLEALSSGELYQQ